MKSSKVKVATFRIVDHYTRENKFVIVSMYPVSKTIKEAKSFFNGCLEKHFACVAECEEYGPLPSVMAQTMTDTFQRANPCVMVFNLFGEERAVS